MNISPCIIVCETDPITEFCYGCARTREEINLWKDETTTNDWKDKNLIGIQNRISMWQISSFKESYNHKIKYGISLVKNDKLKESK